MDEIDFEKQIVELFEKQNAQLERLNNLLDKMILASTMRLEELKSANEPKCSGCGLGGVNGECEACRLGDFSYANED